MTHPGDMTVDHLLAWPGIRRTPSPALDLFHTRAFLDPTHCARLIELIDANRHPSTIADPNGDAYFRTSETCDLDAEEPAVQELERLLHTLTGIDPHHGEPVQGQRYAVGQEFKAHTDYFEPNGTDYQQYCALAGQRTWTAMVYLNEPQAGGGTRFKHIGKTFQPEQGKLLTWNNRLPDGRVNPATLHHGMKVRKGLKYVITKWYRERPWQ
ncbi:prolyl hydroxylase family protein [Caenibius tardaugens]|nr:2OG-Fe(II) oxygenase [Caenibius tardaugens]AZI37190.1 2OG-Fe(II) oxygenase [Caenibius tardaugens NBRC 16725]